MEVKYTFKGITEELKKEAIALMEKFNVISAPVVPATPAVAPVAKFGEATLKDGTIVKWEGDMPLAQGTAVMVIDPANPSGFLPAPDGDLEFQDGTVVTIKEGKVESIKPSTPAPAPAAQAAPQMVAQMEKVKAELSEVKAQFAKVESEKTALEAKFSAEIEANKKAIEELNKVSKGMFEVLMKALDAPTAEPVITPDNVIGKKNKKEALLEKLK